MSNLNILNTFTLDNLPDLDTVTLGALERLPKEDLPDITTPFQKPLIVGSGNAIATGKIIFRDTEARFADESSYKTILKRVSDIDGIVLISASGGKHALNIAADLKDKGLFVILFTNNPTAPAAQHLPEDNVRVFPKNREPYTYNTSTYLSQIMAKEDEKADEIRQFIEENISTLPFTNLGNFSAYTIILPTEFSELKEMLRTKFDELFGPKICGRVFTSEEIKHAKTVVHDEKELFISLGQENETYGSPDNRLYIPLPSNGSYTSAFAVSYYLMGQIQKSHPAYFKQNISGYCEEISRIFNQEIKPIVD